jgi:hypothetical protein
MSPTFGQDRFQGSRENLHLVSQFHPAMPTLDAK